MKKIGSLFLAVCCVVSTYAQKGYVELSLSANKAEQGEVFMLSITTNLSGEISIALPTGFEKVGMISQGKSTIIENGRRIQESVISQGYVCNKSGKYKIGPAIVNGKESNVTNLEVIKAPTEADKYMNSAVQVEPTGKPVFGKITSDKKSVYAGEAFVVDSKIYSRYNVLGIDQSYALSKAKGGLETISLQDPTKYNSGQIRIEGVPHVYIDFAKQLCFASSVGTASMSPFSAAIQIEAGFFPESSELKSNTFQIEVKPLPNNKPNSYQGLVGSFDFKLEPNTVALKQGEVFPVSLAVSGLGNLHLVAQPNLNLPEGFEIYGEVKRQEEIEYTNNGSNGTVTFMYSIRATKPGKLKFPNQDFSFFNLASESYQTISTSGFEVNVTPNPNFKLDTSKLDIDFDSTSNSSIFWKLILAIILFCGALFFYFKWKKTIKSNIMTTDKIVRVKPVDLENSKPTFQKHKIIFPNDLAFMSTANMTSFLYSTLLKQMQNSTCQEFASFPDLLEILKFKNSNQVIAIEEAVGVINNVRYGGEGMMEQRAKEELIRKVREVVDGLS